MANATTRILLLLRALPCCTPVPVKHKTNRGNADTLEVVAQAGLSWLPRQGIRLAEK